MHSLLFNDDCLSQIQLVQLVILSSYPATKNLADRSVTRWGIFSVLIKNGYGTIKNMATWLLYGIVQYHTYIASSIIIDTLSCSKQRCSLLLSTIPAAKHLVVMPDSRPKSENIPMPVGPWRAAVYLVIKISLRRIVVVAKECHGHRALQCIVLHPEHHCHRALQQIMYLHIFHAPRNSMSVCH
jgi:hypothetical protein